MKVAIVGAAGTVGSCTAFTLALQGLASELLLIDPHHNLLLNHAMDISAAAAVQNSTHVRAGTWSDLPGSDIVILSAGVHIAGAPVKERLAPNLPIISEVSAAIQSHCPQAVVITAANPVDLLNYAVYLSTSLDRRQLIGFNLNDTTRFRLAVADTLAVAPTRVEALAVGDHPSYPVQLFSTIKVDGSSVSVDKGLKLRLQQELRTYLKTFEGLKAGRTAGWTSAAGIAALVGAIAQDSRKIFSCSAVLQGEYGYRGFGLGVPAVIGRQGICQVVELPLPPDELQELDIAARGLRSNAEYVRQVLGKDRS